MQSMMILSLFLDLENYQTAVNTYDVHKFNVSFDFNIEACASGKSSNIALLGGSNAGTWLSSDKQILTIAAPATGNGTFGTITINGNEVSPSIKETITTSDFNSLKREATGWVTLNATVDFSTKKVTYTLKKGETTVVESTTADFVIDLPADIEPGDFVIYFCAVAKNVSMGASGFASTG